MDKALAAQESTATHVAPAESSDPAPAGQTDATVAWRRSMTPGAWLMINVGAGMMGGVPLGDWLRLLVANRFAVWPRYWPRAAVITLWSAWNSLFRWIEDRRYGAALENVAVPPPLFILGHWRSGTTLLHNLFAIDERFAYANLYQTANPHTLLTTQGFMAKLAAPKRSNRIVDEIAIGFDAPFEDEFAIAAACFKSQYVGLVFPRRAERYDRYLTMNDAPPADLAEWQRAFLTFARKLTLHTRRPLVFKSPGHTARVAALLSIFPEARFIHIHRNPYDVMRSTRHLFSFLIRQNTLQRPDWSRLDDRIITQYRAMHESYLSQRELIPAGRLHEIAFADLERDPVREMGRAYEALRLPDFEAVRPAVTGYVGSLQSYKKNRHADLPEGLKRRLESEWRRSFEAWGYPVDTARPAAAPVGAVVG